MAQQKVVCILRALGKGALKAVDSTCHSKLIFDENLMTRENFCLESKNRDQTYYSNLL